MTPQDIKKLLIDRDMTQAQIARSLDVSPTIVSLVIKYKRTTPRIRRGIADAMNVPYLLVWGEKDPGAAAERRVAMAGHDQDFTSPVAGSRAAG